MQSPPHLPLPALRAFEATARLSSFTMAANELAMTQAAVSYQVKKLEDFLGVRVFHRAGRHIQLTPDGQELASALSEAFAAIRSACTLAASKALEHIRITALLTVGTNWLVPRLGRFQAQWPHWKVLLDTSVEAADMRLGSFDLAIRSGEGNWHGCKSEFLFENRYTVVVPAGLRPISNPDDLFSLPLFGRPDWWTQWLSTAGASSMRSKAKAPTSLGTQLSEVLAARKQGGAAIVTPAFFADDLATGSLEIPFDVHLTHGGGYWLVYSHESSKRQSVRAFRDWINLEVCL